MCAVCFGEYCVVSVRVLMSTVLCFDVYCAVYVRDYCVVHDVCFGVNVLSVLCVLTVFSQHTIRTKHFEQ